jgi:flagellar biosynthesis/type III secretory pathway protein FliH
MNPTAASGSRKREDGLKRAPNQFFPSLASLKREREPDQEDAHQRWLADEFEKARMEGFRRGYDDGINAARAEAAKLYESARREGCERGMEEGRKDAARAAEALRKIHGELDHAYQSALAELESFSLEFCMGLLKRLTGANPLRRTFLLKAIREAVASLKPNGARRVMLSPADIAIVNGLLDGLEVHEDPALEPGGFRVEGGPIFVEGSLSAAMAQVEQAIIKKKKSETAID